MEDTLVANRKEKNKHQVGALQQRDLLTRLADNLTADASYHGIQCCFGIIVARNSGSNP